MGSEDMKIRIEVDREIQEDEVIIRCKQLNGSIFDRHYHKKYT